MNLTGTSISPSPLDPGLPHGLAKAIKNIRKPIKDTLDNKITKISEVSGLTKRQALEYILGFGIYQIDLPKLQEIRKIAKDTVEYEIKRNRLVKEFVNYYKECATIIANKITKDCRSDVSYSSVFFDLVRINSYPANGITDNLVKALDTVNDSKEECFSSRMLIANLYSLHSFWLDQLIENKNIGEMESFFNNRRQTRFHYFPKDKTNKDYVINTVSAILKITL